MEQIEFKGEEEEEEREEREKKRENEMYLIKPSLLSP